MKRSTLITLKTLTWIACLSPFSMLVYQAVTNTLGPDPTSTIALTTGYNALLLLILSLAITPLRLLSPRLSWLIKFRRLLGSHLAALFEDEPGADEAALEEDAEAAHADAELDPNALIDEALDEHPGDEPTDDN